MPTMSAACLAPKSKKEIKDWVHVHFELSRHQLQFLLLLFFSSSSFSNFRFMCGSSRLGRSKEVTKWRSFPVPFESLWNRFISITLCEEKRFDVE